MIINLIFLPYNQGYPETEKYEVGYPGYPPCTQWIVEEIPVYRITEGKHLQYRKATAKGMSGSPLFFMDKNRKKAIVVGVHVGGSKTIANCAVPISYHKETTETWCKNSSSIGTFFKTSICTFFAC